ncbi:hypothetical protein CQ11_01850 [Trueperella pyogenes]|nr:hypothetical protein CQ11_01850 [Trueperella pyogenes]AJC70622.1 hypothetical protein X956_06935 [Trueperella pyogenes TP8]ALD74440.1 hypothetical protein AN946_09205 [Trueperella pyogenes]OQD39391.1 hypothetical protein B1R42_02735 [Trueperella pyogenes]
MDTDADAADTARAKGAAVMDTGMAAQATVVADVAARASTTACARKIRRPTHPRTSPAGAAS